MFIGHYGVSLAAKRVDVRLTLGRLQRRGQIALELGMRYAGLARALVLGGTQYRFSESYLEDVRALLGITDGGEEVEREHPDFVAYLPEAVACGAWPCRFPISFRTYVQPDQARMPTAAQTVVLHNAIKRMTDRPEGRSHEQPE